MVTWEFYFARKHVTNFRTWAASRGISDRADLVKELESIGTTIPSPADTKLFLPIPPVQVSPVHHVAVPKPVTPKKVQIHKEQQIDQE